MTETSDWSDAFLDSLPAWTLVRAVRPVAARFYALFAEHDLGPTEFGVLAQLAAGAVPSQAELARRVLITPQSLHPLLATMIDRGLIARTGGPGRGRRQNVELTLEGRAVLERIRPGLLRLNEASVLGVRDDEAESLNRILHAVLRTGSS